MNSVIYKAPIQPGRYLCRVCPVAAFKSPLLHLNSNRHQVNARVSSILDQHEQRHNAEADHFPLLPYDFDDAEHAIHHGQLQFDINTQQFTWNLELDQCASPISEILRLNDLQVVVTVYVDRNYLHVGAEVLYPAIEWNANISIKTVIAIPNVPVAVCPQYDATANLSNRESIMSLGQFAVVQLGAMCLQGSISIFGLTYTNETIMDPLPGQSAPQRGRPQVDRDKLNNITNRALLGWHLKHYAQRHSQAATTELLRILNAPWFDPTDMASSMYLLNQIDALTIPDLPVKKLKLKSGKFLDYYDPADVLRLVLQSSDLTVDWIREGNINSEYVDHPCTSEGWDKYVQHKKQKDPAGLWELLLFSLFVDGYRQKQCRGIFVTGVELVVENLAPELAKTRGVRYLLCNAANDEEVSEFFEKIIVPLHQELVHGKFQSEFVPAGNKIKKFYGGIHMIKGDHMGQLALMGRKGVAASKNSRTDNITRDKISQFFKWTSDVREAVRFKPAEIYKQVQRSNLLQAEGRVSITRELDQLGFHAISPLWKAEVFRDDFFKRFAICFLHLLLLGWAKTVFTNLGRLHGEQFIERVNTRASILEPVDGVASLRRGVYFIGTNKKGERTIKIRPLNGTEMRGLLKVCGVLFKYELSTLEIRLLRSLQQVFWNLDAPSIKRAHLEPGGRIHKAINTLQALFLKVLPADRFSRSWPNFQTLNRAPDAVLFLGSDIWMSTSPHEANHYRYREIAATGNNHNIQRDTLTTVGRIQRYKYNLQFSSYVEQTAYEDALEEIRPGTTSLKIAVAVGASIGSIDISSMDQHEVDHLLDICPANTDLEPELSAIKLFPSVRLACGKVKVGDTIMSTSKASWAEQKVYVVQQIAQVSIDTQQVDGNKRKKTSTEKQVVVKVKRLTWKVGDKMWDVAGNAVLDDWNLLEVIHVDTLYLKVQNGCGHILGKRPTKFY